MAAVDVRSPAGDRVGSVELDGAYFGVTPNTAVLHQVVTAQLAAARAGGASTLTRAEVSGGGRKPWRQKGTGRARQGSTRAPHWTGGGVAMGPQPRSYRQRTPKKMIRLALCSALSDRAAEGRVAVVDAWDFPVPSTKQARAALAALALEGRVLVVVEPDADNVRKSFRNLPQVRLTTTTQLNAYDVLCADWVLFTRTSLPGGEPTPGAPAEPPTPSTPAPEAPTSSTPAPEAPTSSTPAPEAAGDDHDWDAPLRRPT